MTSTAVLVILGFSILWNCVEPTPLRHRSDSHVRPMRDDSVESWDYQSDVYNNRVVDDVPKRKSAASSAERFTTGSDERRRIRIQPAPRELTLLSQQQFGELINPNHPKPSARDLRGDELLKLLDGAFSERLLSIERPPGSILYPNGTMETNFKKGLPKDELPDEIQHLKFPRPSLEGSREVRVKDSAYRRLIRQYLWASSYCPVVYKWADLGPNFWPRWINEGSCYNGRSCSIPAGMSCHPQETQEVSLLFWSCRSRRSCKWIPFKHQIVSKCQCGCWHATWHVLTRYTPIHMHICCSCSC